MRLGFNKIPSFQCSECFQKEQDQNRTLS
jgi:hypothetical protein